MQDLRQQLRELSPSYALQCAARDLIASLDYKIEWLEHTLHKVNIQALDYLERANAAEEKLEKFINSSVVER